MVLAVDSGRGSVGSAEWASAEHRPKLRGSPAAGNRCTWGWSLPCGTARLSGDSPPPILNEILALSRRTRVLPEPLGSVRDTAAQLCNRSVRISQAAGSDPALPAHRRRGPDPALPSHRPRDSDHIPSRGTPRSHHSHPRTRGGYRGGAKPRGRRWITFRRSG